MIDEADRDGDSEGFLAVLGILAHHEEDQRP